MKNNFFLSSTCSKETYLPDAVRGLVGMGVQNIEFSGNLKFYPEREDDIGRVKEKYGLNILLHHYFPSPEEDFFINLASPDKVRQDQALSLIKRAANLLKKYDIPLYSGHTGHNIDMIPRLVNNYFILRNETLIDMTKAEEIFYDNLAFVLKEFFSTHGKLAIENTIPKNERENYCVMSTTEEMEEFIDFSRSHDNLGLLLDLGHLNITGHFFGFDADQKARYLLKNYPDKIFMMHCSANDGPADNHYVHTRNSWQIKILEDFNEQLKDKPIVFEWHSKFNSEQDIAQGVDLLKDVFGSDVFCNQAYLKQEDSDG